VVSEEPEALSLLVGREAGGPLRSLRPSIEVPGRATQRCALVALGAAELDHLRIDRDSEEFEDAMGPFLIGLDQVLILQFEVSIRWEGASELVALVDV